MSYNDICPICLEDIKNPKILDCGHVYCIECMELLIKHRISPEALSCPLCFRKIDYTEKRFILLPYKDKKMERLACIIVYSFIFFGALIILIFDKIFYNHQKFTNIKCVT